jgi:hypothetical protein
MSLATANTRYLDYKLRAIEATNNTFKTVLPMQFRVGRWTMQALESIATQWEPNRHPDASWDWELIVRRYGDPDDFAFTGWVHDGRLAFVGLATTTGVAVELKFLEGDPRSDCPLEGYRALVALDLCWNYAQGCGRNELWVRPVNDSVASLYTSYGFELASPKRQEPYFRRRV